MPPKPQLPNHRKPLSLKLKIRKILENGAIEFRIIGSGDKCASSVGAVVSTKPKRCPPVGEKRAIYGSHVVIGGKDGMDTTFTLNMDPGPFKKPD